MSWAVHITIVDGMAELSSTSTLQERYELAKQTGVKRPKRCTSITGPATWAAQQVLGDLQIDQMRLGIISCGGNFHFQHCFSFLERALEGSPELVNPLEFPHTLVSALPTTIAEVLQAKAFAFTLGDDELAIFDIFAAAYDLLTLGAADCIIGVFCNSNENAFGLTNDGASPKVQSTDCALALRITLKAHTNSTKVQLSPMGVKPHVLYDALSIQPKMHGATVLYGPAVGGVLLNETLGLKRGFVDIGIRNSRGFRSLRLGEHNDDAW